MRRSWLTAASALAAVAAEASPASAQLFSAPATVDFGDTLVGSSSSKTFGMIVLGSISSGSVSAATAPFSGGPVSVGALTKADLPLTDLVRAGRARRRQRIHRRESDQSRAEDPAKRVYLPARRGRGAGRERLDEQRPAGQDRNIGPRRDRDHFQCRRRQSVGARRRKRSFGKPGRLKRRLYRRRGQFRPRRRRRDELRLQLRPDRPRGRQRERDRDLRQWQRRWDKSGRERRMSPCRGRASARNIRATSAPA